MVVDWEARQSDPAKHVTLVDGSLVVGGLADDEIERLVVLREIQGVGHWLLLRHDGALAPGPRLNHLKGSVARIPGTPAFIEGIERLGRAQDLASEIND